MSVVAPCRPQDDPHRRGRVGLERLLQRHVQLLVPDVGDGVPGTRRLHRGWVVNAGRRRRLGRHRPQCVQGRRRRLRCRHEVRRVPVGLDCDRRSRRRSRRWRWQCRRCGALGRLLQLREPERFRRARRGRRHPQLRRRRRGDRGWCLCRRGHRQQEGGSAQSCQGDTEQQHGHADLARCTGRARSGCARGANVHRFPSSPSWCVGGWGNAWSAARSKAPTRMGQSMIAPRPRLIKARPLPSPNSGEISAQDSHCGRQSLRISTLRPWLSRVSSDDADEE